MKLSAKSLRKKSKRIKILEELSRVDGLSKEAKRDRDLIPAIKAGKINDSEYDQELVKKNITKLLKKVN